VPDYLRTRTADFYVMAWLDFSPSVRYSLEALLTLRETRLIDCDIEYFKRYVRIAAFFELATTERCQYGGPGDSSFRKEERHRILHNGQSLTAVLFTILRNPTTQRTAVSGVAIAFVSLGLIYVNTAPHSYARTFPCFVVAS
jgi:hypothetical protein